MKKLRTIFFGTPGLSANILKYLQQQEEFDIIGVVSNPDKPAGRGHQMIASAVAQLAREQNISLYQPEKIRDEDFLKNMSELEPDICIVVAYGKILPQTLLDIPRMGFLNVHTSLLPKYRGAAPIQHALLEGEKITGLTVQQMALGMDEGDILAQESWEITPQDTTGKFFEKTSERAGPLLVETIQGLTSGTITPLPQNHDEASYTKMIEKKDGEIQFSWTVDRAYHAWQAYTPWPGLHTFFGETRVTLLEIERGDMRDDSEQNEGFFVYENLPAIQLTDGILLVKKIHPAGKKPMSGEEFVRGFMQKNTVNSGQ